MTRADILVKLPRRKLADMVIELEHKLNNSEERSFDYASRLVRLNSLYWTTNEQDESK